MHAGSRVGACLYACRFARGYVCMCMCVHMRVCVCVIVHACDSCACVRLRAWIAVGLRGRGWCRRTVTVKKTAQSPRVHDSPCDAMTLDHQRALCRSRLPAFLLPAQAFTSGFAEVATSSESLVVEYAATLFSGVRRGSHFGAAPAAGVSQGCQVWRRGRAGGKQNERFLVSQCRPPVPSPVPRTHIYTHRCATRSPRRHPRTAS